MRQPIDKRPVALAIAMMAVFSTAQLCGCDKGESSRQDDREHADERAAEPSSNRIDIPPSVRQNLGITFVRVEKRPVNSTIRLPGQFEFRPEARR